MIEAKGLTKRYGRTVAVSDLSFTVVPGRVTGFLGPNGAGKSTTMRMILGLDRPTAGDVRVDGKRYADLKYPLRKVGSLLDAHWVHPKRSARSHLRWLAKSNSLPASRVDEVLEIVGLTAVAGKRAGTFSLGMSQRLGLAAALLGDPEVLLFDEPVNGLDPEGILWIRQLMHGLAGQGRTVFVSSHLLSEMALTAQELVVIGRGRMITQTSTQHFIDHAAESTVRVRGPQPDQLRVAFAAAGLSFTETAATASEPASFTVSGATTDQVGEAAGRGGAWLHELVAQRGSLEQAFIQVTGGEVEYKAAVAAPAAANALPAAIPGPASPGTGAGTADHAAVGAAER